MSAWNEDISESAASYGVPDIPENVHYAEGKEEIKVSSACVYDAEPFSDNTKGRLGLKSDKGSKSDSLLQDIESINGDMSDNQGGSAPVFSTVSPTKTRAGARNNRHQKS